MLCSTGDGDILLRVWNDHSATNKVIRDAGERNNWKAVCSMRLPKWIQRQNIAAAGAGECFDIAGSFGFSCTHHADFSVERTGLMARNVIHCVQYNKYMVTTRVP